MALVHEPDSRGDIDDREIRLREQRVGDESKQLQACANCHGPDGSGERYAAPYLAGQSAVYLANAIREWKAGTRHSGEKQMGPVVLRLDDEDIAALSAYLESLGEASH